MKAPRLSVDIDLNYIGSTDREVMYSERPKLEQSIIDVGRGLNLDVLSGTEEHSGRSFKLYYRSEFGSDYVKIDVDYLNRSPLLPIDMRAIKTNDGSIVTFPLNASIEIIGGKVKALLGRVIPRDLYDICRIAEIYPALLETGDKLLLRRILLYYLSLSDPFPKPFKVAERFAHRKRDVEAILYPTLITGDHPDLQSMIQVASTFISNIAMPQNEDESHFLESAAVGDFSPELLFNNYPEALHAALNDPAAQWKMQNIRKMVRREEC